MTFHPHIVVLCLALLLSLGCKSHQTGTAVNNDDPNGTQAAIEAGKELGPHEAIIVGYEQLETPMSKNGYYCNVHAYNRAFHYEAQALGACHVITGAIARLEGAELLIKGDDTVYDVWVSTPVKR